MSKEGKCSTFRTKTLGVVIIWIKKYIEELSDHENMIDEQQLEPDYYIDRPV